MVKSNARFLVRRSIIYCFLYVLVEHIAACCERNSCRYFAGLNFATVSLLAFAEYNFKQPAILYRDEHALQHRFPDGAL